MRGERPPTHEGEPQCGWFRTRLVKNGPWVAARIALEQEIDPETGELTDDERLVCEVAGERRNPVNAWLSLANRPISRADYDALEAARLADPRMAAVLAEFDITTAPPRPARRF